MNQRQRAALDRVGISVERYVLSDTYPAVWGLALVKDGRDLVAIETFGETTDDRRLRNRYVCRARRARVAARAARDLDLAAKPDLGAEISVHRTQREAVATAVRRMYL